MFTRAALVLLQKLLQLVALLVTLVRVAVSGFTRWLEAYTSPSRVAPVAWGSRAVFLLGMAGASIGGLLYGAQRVTHLDPHPWHPHAGPGGDRPPAAHSSSYLSASFTPTQLVDGRRLHHITVATHGEEGLARLVRSASWHGNSIKVLGVGDRRLQQWGVGFGVKVECFLAFAAQVDPADLILFTDAFDVIMWGGHDDVVEGYDRAVARSANVPDTVLGADRPGPRFLVSAEHLPTSWNGIDYGAQYPSTDVAGNHFPYLNSGSFMGPAKDWLSFLSSAEMDMNDNDQAFFNALYLRSLENASLPRVALDHANDVFLTLTAAPPLREKVDTHLKYDVVARRWRHVSTPGFPTVFHSPGWARWKQAEEAWGLAQGRHCTGYTASLLQWPALPAIALDATLVSLAVGLAAGLLLPLLAVCATRSPAQKAFGSITARVYALPGTAWLLPLVCGSSSLASLGLSLPLWRGGPAHGTHGGSAAYAPVDTSDAASANDD